MSNETNDLKSTLATAVNGLLGRLEKAEAFVLKEAPAVVQELVAREVLRQKFDIVISSLFLLAGSLGLAWVHDNFSPKGYYDVAAVCLIILVLVTLLWVLGSIRCLLEIKVAPKLFVIEYLRNLVASKEQKDE